MSIFLRDDRALFKISGNDAEKLLHDVLTATISSAVADASWWALLSPQGKIQSEGLIAYADGAFWLDTNEVSAADFYKRMRLYKLRAKVDIEDMSPTHRVGWSAERPGAAGMVHADSRGAGYRIIAPVDDNDGWEQSGDVYNGVRIDLGLAELGPDYAPDSQFPHDVGMDLLGGVDFQKGCFVGQEVVSRMHHRGTARRRPVIVTGIPAGDGRAVLAGGREAGMIGRVVGGSAVGLLRIDRISDPEDATVSGQPVTLSLPGWATYAFGESPVAD
jgi:hypothetical protein